MAVESLEWRGTTGPVVVMRLGADGAIVAATPNAVEVLGLERNGGRCFLSDLVHPGDRHAVAAVVTRAQNGIGGGIDCRSVLASPAAEGERWLRIELPAADVSGDHLVFV